MEVERGGIENYMARGGPYGYMGRRITWKPHTPQFPALNKNGKHKNKTTHNKIQNKTANTAEQKGKPENRKTKRNKQSNSNK